MPPLTYANYLDLEKLLTLQKPRSTPAEQDRKSTRLNSSHSQIPYAVFCLKKKKNKTSQPTPEKSLRLNSTFRHIDCPQSQPLSAQPCACTVRCDAAQRARSRVSRYHTRCS